MKLFPPTQIDQILNKVAQSDRAKNLKSFINNKTGFNSTNNSFDFDQLKTERIFHLDQIRKVCIDYRLRFLDIKYFKGNIPVEAIQKITLLEKKTSN